MANLQKIKLEELNQIDFTKIELEDVKEEIIDYLINHPDYNTKWDNFYDSDTGRLIVDTLVYLAKKIIVRTDLIANENFPSTAQQDSSKLKMIDLLGYELRSVTNATCYLRVTYPEGSPTLPTGDKITIPLDFTIPAKSTEGRAINFYIRKDTFKGYTESAAIPESGGKAKQGIFLKAYSGDLIVETIDRSDIQVQRDNESYILTRYPVTQDSIRAFYPGETEPIEVYQTDSFFNVSYTDTKIYFVVNYDEFNRATITFASSTLATLLPNAVNLDIYYCVGGGVTHNILEGSIDYTTTLTTAGGETAVVNFSNVGKGYGGKDAETIENAAQIAPLSLRTINRAVTEQDYAILLAKQGGVMFSKILAPNNNSEYFPAGTGAPLFHVWIHVTPNKVINTMEDLLLTKVVSDDGYLIGGDAYDIVEYLSSRRIIGIENVLKPSEYTRLFFQFKITHNKFINYAEIESQIRTTLQNMLYITASGYEKTIRTLAITTEIKKIKGVLDVEILEMRKQTFIQVLDAVSSNFYFRYSNDDPAEVVITDTVYNAEYDEVVFLLNSTTDVELIFESAVQ